MEKNNELSHVGVIGMKWGRRRAERRAEGYSKASKLLNTLGIKGTAKRLHVKAEIYGVAGKRLDKKIKEIERERFKKNLVKAKKRSKEVNDLVNDLVNEGAGQAKRRGKKFDKAADRKYWEHYFKGQLKAKDIQRERDRITKAQNTVENILAMAGDLVIH